MKPERILDVECFVNWFLIGFTDVATRTHLDLQWPIDAARVRQVFAESTIVTFNGWKYDVPMIVLALSGADQRTLKQASDSIIQWNLQPWQFYERNGLTDPTDTIDHIDLIEVAPGIASLKTYGGRLGSRKLQDLPFPHDHWLSDDDKRTGTLYCQNDRLTTIDLLEAVRPQLALRERVGAEYGLDLRSKSDAQMAEAIMRHAAGRYVERPVYALGSLIHYTAPDWVQFQTPGLQRALYVAQTSPFTVVEKENKKTDDGELRTALEMHPDLATMQITIARNAYRMGMGGIHSSESCVWQREDAGHILSDFDVASYYPRLILNLGIEPPQLRGVFRPTYQGWVDRRLAAKAAGDKVIADAFKVVVNGTFGKLGSKWSVMYHPESMVRVTLTGQLALLMLIEAFELSGIAVVSANTDGIVVRCPRHLVHVRDTVIRQWSARTSLELEETIYRTIYSRDVNNYIAVKPDGKVKTKGAYADEGLSKNPTTLVCLDAVRAYLTAGTPLQDTIAACTDVRRFVSIRKVDGGAVWQGQPIGKTVRWFYGANASAAIHYAESGKTVSDTEGAIPVLELPDSLPSNIDHMWYLRKAVKMLTELGVRY